MKLRDFQKNAIDDTSKKLREGVKKPLIVAPTASGKSVIIAGIAKEIIQRGKRPLILCHQAEILEQNEAALKRVYNCSTGVYCAGAGRKETSQQAIFASRDSIAGKVDQFGHFDCVIVDEAHSVGTKKETRYQKIFDAVTTDYVIGLTGTPWRLDNGPIWGDSGFFDSVSYNIGMSLLMARGYLCRYIIPERPETVIDASGVRIKSTGDYDEKELSELSSNDEIVKTCLDLWQAHAKYRHCSIFFCVDLAHAEVVRDELTARGFRVGYLDGKTARGARRELIDCARAGHYQCLVNVGTLTTGVDIPIIDCVVGLRATKSASLFVQMNGRGLRLHPHKKNMLALDLAGNFDRFQSLETPLAPEPKNNEQPGEPPQKACPACSYDIHVRCKECPYCGHIFEGLGVSERKLPFEWCKPKATGWFDVKSWSMYKGQTRNGEDCMIVSYEIGKKVVKEWLLYTRHGWAGEKARARLKDLNACKDVIGANIKDINATYPRINKLRFV